MILEEGKTDDEGTLRVGLDTPITSSRATSEEGVNKEFLHSLSNLFTTTDPGNFPDQLNSCLPKLSTQEAQGLLEPVTDQEIKAALWKMDGNKLEDLLPCF